MLLISLHGSIHDVPASNILVDTWLELNLGVALESESNFGSDPKFSGSIAIPECARILMDCGSGPAMTNRHNEVIMSISKVGVVGAGTMGNGIAQVCAACPQSQDTGNADGQTQIEILFQFRNRAAEAMNDAGAVGFEIDFENLKKTTPGVTFMENDGKLQFSGYLQLPNKPFFLNVSW